MPLPSTANTCSCQIALSAWPRWLVADSACLAFAGTITVSSSHAFCLSHVHFPTTLPSRGFPTPRFSGCPLQRLGTRGRTPGYFKLSFGNRFQFVFGLVLLLQPIGTTMALTPASRHLRRQVSPLISLHLPDVPPPITSCNPGIALHAISQRTGRVSDFAVSTQARHHTPPNRVRFTADRQFASGCSPPRLAATQLPLTTGSWLTLTRTFTMPI